jgi:hypothetical protein
LGVDPAQKPDAAAMCAATDFRMQSAIGWQRDAKHLNRGITLKDEMEIARTRDFVTHADVFAREPQDVLNCIAEWTQHVEPSVEVCASRLCGET